MSDANSQRTTVSSFSAVDFFDRGFICRAFIQELHPCREFACRGIADGKGIRLCAYFLIFM